MSQHAPSIDAQQLVVRAADVPTVSLSPTNRFRFPFAGRDDHPEMYLEQAGTGDGPPMHSHAWATWEMVLEGSVLFSIDGEESLLEAGDAIYTPPHAAHAYTVKSEHARILGLNGPGARLFQLQSRAEPLFAEPGPPNMEQLVGLADEAGVKVLGPPLAVRDLNVEEPRLDLRRTPE